MWDSFWHVRKTAHFTPPGNRGHIVIPNCQYHSIHIPSNIFKLYILLFGVEVPIAGDAIRRINNVQAGLGPLGTLRLIRLALALTEQMLLRSPRGLVLEKIGAVGPRGRLGSRLSHNGRCSNKSKTN